MLLSTEMFFNTCGSVFKINSFTVKNDKISHFKNPNHASHLKGVYKLKNLFSKIEKVLTFCLSRILQPSINNTSFSYYFRILKWLLRARIIFVCNPRYGWMTLNEELNNLGMN